MPTSRLKSHLKFNTYYLKNKDQIHVQNLTNVFDNSGNNNLYGVEVEYKNTLTNDDQIYVNYSYVEGENVAGELANYAETMAKAYYLHNINNALSASVVAKYVNEKDRVEEDPRGNVSSYVLFDLSVNYQYRPENVNINLSVKNLLDEIYFLPSPVNTYPGDFEQEGRSIMLSLSKRF